jgi:hypothetical protein
MKLNNVYYIPCTNQLILVTHVTFDHLVVFTDGSGEWTVSLAKGSYINPRWKPVRIGTL